MTFFLHTRLVAVVCGLTRERVPLIAQFSLSFSVVLFVGIPKSFRGAFYCLWKIRASTWKIPLRKTFCLSSFFFLFSLIITKTTKHTIEKGWSSAFFGSAQHSEEKQQQTNTDWEWGSIKELAQSMENIYRYFFSFLFVSFFLFFVFLILFLLFLCSHRSVLLPAISTTTLIQCHTNVRMSLCVESFSFSASLGERRATRRKTRNSSVDGRGKEQHGEGKTNKHSKALCVGFVCWALMCCCCLRDFDLSTRQELLNERSLNRDTGGKGEKIFFIKYLSSSKWLGRTCFCKRRTKKYLKVLSRKRTIIFSDRRWRKNSEVK